MKTTLISTPVPVVSLDDAKSYFRVLHAEEDTDIQRVITAATEKATNITNRALVRGTYEMRVDDFSTVELEMTPFVSVGSVAYIAVDGSTKPLTGYTTKVNSLTDRAMLSFTEIPTDLHEGDEQIIVTYEAGYEPTPASIQSFILAEGLTLFHNRQYAEVEGVISSGNRSHYHRLLDSYRIIPV